MRQGLPLLLLVLTLIGEALAIEGRANAGTARPVPEQVSAILRKRVEQRKPKMKLTSEQGRAISDYFAALPDTLVQVARLAERMPHAAIELVRAMHERGVSVSDAEAIAGFLLGMIEAGNFQNPRQLDINHSHVIGRDWHQIDYTGEGMTWQGQKAYWAPKGVTDFKKAEHIRAYFHHACRLRYFQRIYQPRGDLPAWFLEYK